MARTDLTACPGCGGAVRQDEDVLDTWFSSWLWPFSTLGWPEQTADLKRVLPRRRPGHRPGDPLLLGGPHGHGRAASSMGELPFHTVYLHGTVRDTQHRKMSKSLGNGIDPLEVIERYGADALRYTVIAGMAVGTDVILDPADLESSFAAGPELRQQALERRPLHPRHLDGPTRPLAGPYPDVIRRDELDLRRPVDHRPLRRDGARRDGRVRAVPPQRRGRGASTTSSGATWPTGTSSRPSRGSTTSSRAATWRAPCSAQTFDVALRLLHPVMPFVTETLWKRLPGHGADASISVAPWPRPDDRATDDEALAGFAEIQLIVTSMRQLRADAGVHPGQNAIARLTTADATTRGRLALETATITRLAKVSFDAVLVRGPAETTPGGLKTAVLPGGIEASIELSAADRERECTRLAKEETHLRQLVGAQEKKLGNEQFVARAPAAVVEGERQKLATWTEQADALADNRRRLGCG